MTLSLNWPWPNICTAHWLIMLDICAELFINPSRGSKDIEWRRKTIIQCLTLNYDLDLEPTLVKHTHCTLSHHTLHLCWVIWKSHQGFKTYRADTKAWRTDRQTNRQTTELKTLCLPNLINITKFNLHKIIRSIQTSAINCQYFLWGIFLVRIKMRNKHNFNWG